MSIFRRKKGLSKARAFSDRLWNAILNEKGWGRFHVEAIEDLGFEPHGPGPIRPPMGACPLCMVPWADIMADFHRCPYPFYLRHPANVAEIERLAAELEEEYYSKHPTETAGLPFAFTDS